MDVDAKLLYDYFYSKGDIYFNKSIIIDIEVGCNGRVTCFEENEEPEEYNGEYHTDRGRGLSVGLLDIIAWVWTKLPQQENL